MTPLTLTDIDASRAVEAARSGEPFELVLPVTKENSSGTVDWMFERATKWRPRDGAYFWVGQRFAVDCRYRPGDRVPLLGTDHLVGLEERDWANTVAHRVKGEDGQWHGALCCHVLLVDSVEAALDNDLPVWRLRGTVETA